MEEYTKALRKCASFGHKHCDIQAMVIKVMMQKDMLYFPWMES